MTENATLELFQPLRPHHPCRKFDSPIIRVRYYDIPFPKSFRCQVTLNKHAALYLKLEKGDRVLLAREPLSGKFCLAYVPPSDPIHAYFLVGNYHSLHFDSKDLHGKIEQGFFSIGEPFWHKPTNLNFYPLTLVIPS
ncbi:MAG: hypothetical protein WCO63_15250 [Bacteroidota bacterium]